MHSSVFLTILVVLSLAMPDFVSLVTSNFSVVEAELLYYKRVADEAERFQNSLVESLKHTFEGMYPQQTDGSSSETEHYPAHLANKITHMAGFNNCGHFGECMRQRGNSKTKEEEEWLKIVHSQASSLTGRFVSKTSKNEILLDPINDRLYLISIDNRFLFADNRSYSYLSIMELHEERLFGGVSYERDGQIQWQLCTLHKFKGVISEIQFDSQRHSFAVVFSDDQHRTKVRTYSFSAFCRNQNHATTEEENALIKLISEESSQDNQQNNFKQYYQQNSQRTDLEYLFKITQNTRFTINPNKDIVLTTQGSVLKIGYSSNMILFAPLHHSSLLMAMPFQNNLSKNNKNNKFQHFESPNYKRQSDQHINNTNYQSNDQTTVTNDAQEEVFDVPPSIKALLPSFSQTDRDYIQILNIQILQPFEIHHAHETHKETTTTQFIVTLLKGNHEEIFIECEAHKARADHPDIDFSKHYAHEEVQTLFSRNVTSKIRSIDIFKNELFPSVNTAYNHRSKKMVISILDQYLILLDFSLPSMISITDIEPNNYSKLAKEGFRLKKLQFSHQGHFLCFLAADSEQRSALFLMEIASTVSHIISSQLHADLYQIKEIRERVKSRVIKDFSTYEKGEDSNQLHSVLLLEGGEVVSMSLCTNCSNKFKKSVIKELMDIASTALISVGFLILFIFARTVMASHIDEETEEI